MSNRDDQVGKNDIDENTVGSLRWITTSELAPLVGRGMTTIRTWLEEGDLEAVLKLDPRIKEIKQIPGRGRAGFRWRFLWQKDALSRKLRVGYFSAHFSEKPSVLKERHAAIETFAASIGIELGGIESDLLGRGESQLKNLAVLIHNPLLEIIVTDQEFSLGGVHFECVKEIILAAGIKVICVPGLYRSSDAVKQSYMSEIGRMMSKLLLLGAPVEGLIAQTSEIFQSIREVGDDTGIT